MKTRTAFLSLLTILCLLVAPAMADTLYTNGPPNGTTDAWTINFGFFVSDSFNLAAASSVGGFSMVTWNFPGDNLTSLEMQLGSTAFGSQFTDQVLSPSGSQDLGINQYGYDLQQIDFSFAGVALPSGTSWITLQKANVTFGDPIYWDENSGPSRALACCDKGLPEGGTVWPNALGTIPSESFTVLGGG